MNANTPRAEELCRSYLQFFATFDETEHQSVCSIVTRSKPPQIGKSDRTLELQGLDRQSCQELLEHSDLIGTSNEWEILVAKYRGNPQQLKLVANTIRDIFDRQIAKFLAAKMPIVARIEPLLSAQLNNLSSAELIILSYLSLQLAPVTLDRLVNEIGSQLFDTQIVQTVDKLVSKYLVDIKDDCFLLPELVQAYFKL